MVRSLRQRGSVLMLSREGIGREITLGGQQRGAEEDEQGEEGSSAEERAELGGGGGGGGAGQASKERRRMVRSSMSRRAVLGRCAALLWLCAMGSCLSSDERILQSLAGELKGGGSSAWNTSDGDPCSWRGVLCNGGIVHNLTLPQLHLSGTIPPSIGLLQGLALLDLSGNLLTGPIPANLSACINLSHLNLSANRLSGSIPAPLQQLRQLQTLDLSANSLTEPIPDSLGNLSSLHTLDLSSNALSGSIPQSFRNLTAIRVLSLSRNRLEGSIPETIGELINLQSFSAYQNLLNASMPEMKNPNLQFVNLASNLLSGEIPPSICSSGQLQVLILTNNSFTGTLPEDLGSCSTLSTLRVGQNFLSGGFPDGLGQLEKLVYFEANQNQLTGPIPSSISGWKSLSLLNLAENRLIGVIPTELSMVSSIQEVRLANNFLTGGIPGELWQCKKLSMLDLSENHLSGGIPEAICNSTSLMYLLLQGNSFSGAIPDTLGDCEQLLELQLGDNLLSGSIPPKIGSLLSLQVLLNLSLNNLTGGIPASIGSLNKLVVLDLSHNELSGDIPSLVGMESLVAWNFSYNLLSGPVPHVGTVLNSSSSSYASSYAHNPGLCGSPLPPCGDKAFQNSKGVVSFGKVAGIAISCAIVVLIVLSGIAVAVMRKRQLLSAVDPTPPLMVTRVFLDNFRQAINFDSVKEATGSSTHVISSNHFSTMYKAVMPSGLVLAAKRLHSTEKGVVIHQRKLTLELDKLWKLSHENIMRPMGYLLQDDLAIILYDFVPRSSLGQQLHKHSERLLSWSMRYDIALAAAKGLTFLHQSCHPPMVHMDVTSNIIFLGPNFEVKVGDVEVAKLLDPSKNTGSISAVAGSFGYIAPEYAFTMQVTLASNVYSFGVVLLELVTGRLPIDETYGDVDLVRWVHGASLRGETPEQILDPRISTLSFAARKEMLAVLKVAVLCTNASPLKRPRMKKVLDMLLESRLPAEAHSITK